MKILWLYFFACGYWIPIILVIESICVVIIQSVVFVCKRCTFTQPELPFLICPFHFSFTTTSAFAFICCIYNRLGKSIEINKMNARLMFFIHIHNCSYKERIKKTTQVWSFFQICFVHNGNVVHLQIVRKMFCHSANYVVLSRYTLCTHCAPSFTFLGNFSVLFLGFLNRIKMAIFSHLCDFFKVHIFTAHDIWM